MAISALPTPPSRNDPANFAERGDAFLAALPQFATEANTLQEDVTAKQATASAAATTATQKATDASGSAAGAQQAKIDAETARGAAVTAAGQASDAKTAAETAAGVASAAAASIQALPNAFNVLINSNFVENQRAVSGTVTLAAGAYGHDRFKAGASGCTYTFSKANGITTLNITAGSLQQVVEGDGQIFADTYTLRWTGTAQGRINGGSNAASGVSAALAGGANVTVEWGTGTLSQPHFRRGTANLPWAPYGGIYGSEKQACQRYYETGAFSFVGYAAGGSGFGQLHQFSTTKRIAPAMSMGGDSNGSNINTPGLSATSVNGFGNGATAVATGTAIFYGTFRASAEL